MEECLVKEAEEVQVWVPMVLGLDCGFPEGWQGERDHGRVKEFLQVQHLKRTETILRAHFANEQGDPVELEGYLRSRRERDG